MRAQDQDRVNFWRSAWRPMVAVTCCICLIVLIFAVAALLLLRYAPLTDATAIILAALTALSTPLSIMIGGRSYEKAKGRSIPANELAGSQNEIEINVDGDLGRAVDVGVSGEGAS